jgi:hypothetical protein
MEDAKTYFKKKLLSNFNPILQSHTRKEISILCEVSYNTVLNWIKLKTIPLWAIERLGYDIEKRPLRPLK